MAKSKALKIFIRNVLAELHSRGERPAWLAKKTKLNAPYFSKLLRGHGNPTIERMEVIADALEVSLASLLEE